MSGMKIACVGEVMLELQVSTVPGPAQVGVAGDVLNTAIYLRRMLPKNHSVSFVSLLGDDRLSEDIVRFVAEQNIDTSQLTQLRDKLPGVYAISTDEAGERSFQYWRQNSAARQLFQAEAEPRFDMLAGFDLIYLSAITLAILPQTVRLCLLDWIDSYRARGGLFAFDSNYRPKLWESEHAAREIIEASWRRCDFALPSVDDELAVFHEKDEAEVLTRFSGYTGCVGALKRGVLGPKSINEVTTPSSFEPARTVVDTTAAGDGFNGGYLAAKLSGRSQSEALDQGHELARRIIGFRGAIIPV